MQKLLFILAWLFLTVGTIMTGVATYQFLPQNTPTPLQVLGAVQERITAPQEPTAALEDVKGMEVSIETEDARPQIVANFLKRYKSPLQPYDEYGRKLVAIADKYDIDFRLLPAIAMQESNLCKVIPPDSHNCLGFGIHAKGTLKFESYEEAFETAAKTLKTKYISQPGLERTTPEEIEKKYTPSSGGHWAASVNRWMAEMRYDDSKSGKEKKTTTNLLEFTQEGSVSAKSAPAKAETATSDVASISAKVDEK